MKNLEPCTTGETKKLSKRLGGKAIIAGYIGPDCIKKKDATHSPMFVEIEVSNSPVNYKPASATLSLQQSHFSILVFLSQLISIMETESN